MDRKDLVKKILELSLEVKDVEGVQAMMCITDMENAVKDYEKQLSLYCVSQQRELLLAFLEYVQETNSDNDTIVDNEEFIKGFQSQL
tara:strand:+ start:2102 stop:2362 length:261 start_codon:yes stop_codon:yes gene_type:complete